MSIEFSKYGEVIKALFEVIEKVTNLVPDVHESELRLTIKGKSTNLEILVTRSGEGEFTISINQKQSTRVTPIAKEKEEVEEKKEEETKEVKEEKKEENLLPELPDVEVSFEERHKL